MMKRNKNMYIFGKQVNYLSRKKFCMLNITKQIKRFKFSNLGNFEFPFQKAHRFP